MSRPGNGRAAKASVKRHKASAPRVDVDECEDDCEAASSTKGERRITAAVLDLFERSTGCRFFADTRFDDAHAIYLWPPRSSAVLLNSRAGQALLFGATRSEVPPGAEGESHRSIIASLVWLRTDAQAIQITPLAWYRPGEAVWLWTATSRHAGRWYRLDGGPITDDAPRDVAPLGRGMDCEPVLPKNDGERDRQLDDLLRGIVTDSELTRRWIEIVLVLVAFANHFETLPILVFLGRPFTGKTSAAGMVTGVYTGDRALRPPRRDAAGDFTAAVVGRAFASIDNLDDPKGAAGLLDLLASYTTGGVMESRAYYTNHDRTTVRSHAIPVITSVTGKALSRPDLVSREIILQLAPRDPNEGYAVALRRKLDEARPRHLGAVISLINAVVGELHRNPPLQGATTRLAEVEAVMRAHCRVRGWDADALLAHQAAARRAILGAEEHGFDVELLRRLVDACRDEWSTASDIAERLAAVGHAAPSPQDIGIMLTAVHEGRAAVVGVTVEARTRSGRSQYRAQPVSVS